MKIFMCLLLALVCAQGFADWLQVDFGFQTSYFLNQSDSIYYDIIAKADVYTMLDSTFKIKATLFDKIIIGGDWITKYYFSDYKFLPLGMVYDFYAGIEPVKGIFFIYSHECNHTFHPFFSESLPDSSHDKIFFELRCSYSF
jgi:hypothetical protein